MHHFQVCVLLVEAGQEPNEEDNLILKWQVETVVSLTLER